MLHSKDINSLSLLRWHNVCIVQIFRKPLTTCVWINLLRVKERKANQSRWELQTRFSITVTVIAFHSLPITLTKIWSSKFVWEWMKVHDSDGHKNQFATLIDSHPCLIWTLRGLGLRTGCLWCNEFGTFGMWTTEETRKQPKKKQWNSDMGSLEGFALVGGRFSK